MVSVDNVLSGKKLSQKKAVTMYLVVMPFTQYQVFCLFVGVFWGQFGVEISLFEGFLPQRLCELYS